MSREDSQFKLRMPADLRDTIEQAARKNRRSLNAEIISRLEFTELLDREMGSRTNGDYGHNDAVSWIASLESDNQELRDEVMEFRQNPTIVEGGDIVEAIMSKISSRQMGLLDALQFDQRFIRLKHPGSTHEAIDQLLTCIATLNGIQSVFMGVRDGDGNYSALSVVIETQQLTLVSDETLLTVERPPRESEIRDLLQSLDAMGLLDGPTRFHTERIQPTAGLSPKDAAGRLSNGQLQTLSLQSLPDFLALFHPSPVHYEKHELLRFFADERVIRD